MCLRGGWGEAGWVSLLRRSVPPGSLTMTNGVTDWGNFEGETSSQTDATFTFHLLLFRFRKMSRLLLLLLGGMCATATGKGEQDLEQLSRSELIDMIRSLQSHGKTAEPASMGAGKTEEVSDGGCGGVVLLHRRAMPTRAVCAITLAPPAPPSRSWPRSSGCACRHQDRSRRSRSWGKLRR